MVPFHLIVTTFDANFGVFYRKNERIFLLFCEIWQELSLKELSKIRKKFCHFWQPGWTGGHYAKWNRKVNTIGNHLYLELFLKFQFSLVTQSCPTLCDAMVCSTPGLPVHHQLLEFTQTHVHWVIDAINHLVLCRPLLLLPSIFPSIRVFSNELVPHIRWPKFWSFSYSPFNEYSGF